MRVFLVIALLAVALVTRQCSAMSNGLAMTPPMGWMTWQRFRCNTDCNADPENCISEHLIRTQAEHMARDGYLEAGYEYIIVDDCWLATSRDSNKRLQPDPARFPSGIRALADYVHSLGLKFGIYEDYGTYTCGGYPGSLEHLQLDAETFAEWTVDYLKLDGCYANYSTMSDGYPLMSMYLNATNRPIVFSCSWPAYAPDPAQAPYPRIAEFCNLWRNFDDIDDEWASVKTITDWFTKNQRVLAPVHGPGNWNDMDMLIIGNYGLSQEQSKTQMALWSIFASPLLMSVDLRRIEPFYSDILQNKNLIGINQDPLGIMGAHILNVNYVDIWAKPLTGDRTAFVFMYPLPYGTPVNVTVPLSNLTLDRYPAYNFYESFTGELIGSFMYNEAFSTSVNPSGSCVAFWAEPDSSLDEWQPARAKSTIVKKSNKMKRKPRANNKKKFN